MNEADTLPERVATLERAFRQVAETRMQGVPLLNAALQVQAVGFAPLADEPGVALGVLVTPWFMNLLRLPLAPVPMGTPGWLPVACAASVDQPC